MNSKEVEGGKGEHHEEWGKKEKEGERKKDKLSKSVERRRGQ